LAFVALRLCVQNSQGRLEARATTPAPGRGARQRAARLRGLARPRPLAALAARPAAACTQRAFSTALRARWAHNAACARRLPTAPGSERCGTGKARTRACAYRLGERRYKYQLPSPRTPPASQSFCCGPALLLLWQRSPPAAAILSWCGDTGWPRRQHQLLLRPCTPAAVVHSWCGNTSSEKMVPALPVRCPLGAAVSLRQAGAACPAVRLPACAAGGPR